MTLAVDGNGTFSLDKAIEYARRACRPIRSPGSRSRCIRSTIDLHRELAERMRDLPLATGENLFSADDARNLLRHGGLRTDRDILQFDISLSYGIVEYLRILDDARAHGWSRERCAPHAGHLLAFNAWRGSALGLRRVCDGRERTVRAAHVGMPIADGRGTLSSSWNRLKPRRSLRRVVRVFHD